jgi:hypothetical protein
MSEHLNEEALSQARVDDDHLQVCAQCRERWISLHEGLAVYEQQMARPAPPAAWKSFDELVAAPSAARWRNWAAVAASLALLAGLTWYSMQREAAAPSELAESGLMEKAASLGYAPPARLLVRWGGERYVRKGSVRAATHSDDVLAGLFREADYSWAEPLSPQAWLGWRRKLQQKHDRLQRRANGDYVVETTTRESALQRVELTLKMDSLRPIAGEFQFRDVPLLQIAEAAPEQAPSEGPQARADLLQVLETLQRIGADVEDAPRIEESGEQIVVQLAGGDAERRQQVMRALSPMPGLVVQSTAVGSAQPGTTVNERVDAQLPAEWRQRFEQAYGGPLALQEATDRSLEAASLLLARANALATLNRLYPAARREQLSAADRQRLAALVAGHAKPVRQQVTVLQQNLAPLLHDAQAQEAPLLQTAQRLNVVLTHMLAGQWPAEEGQRQLDELSSLMAALRMVGAAP